MAPYRDSPPRLAKPPQRNSVSRWILLLACHWSSHGPPGLRLSVCLSFLGSLVTTVRSPGPRYAVYRPCLKNNKINKTTHPSLLPYQLWYTPCTAAKCEEASPAGPQSLHTAPSDGLGQQRQLSLPSTPVDPTGLVDLRTWIFIKFPENQIHSENH